MSGQTRSLVAPRSLADVGGSQALAECPTVTRAVGRSATDSEAFWFTAWDWDTQAIWATVRGFFDAYNSGRYDKCLDYVSENAAGKDKGEATDACRAAAKICSRACWSGCPRCWTTACPRRCCTAICGAATGPPMLQASR